MGGRTGGAKADVLTGPGVDKRMDQSCIAKSVCERTFIFRLKIRKTGVNGAITDG